jgi:hypothetical protein
LDGCPVGTGRTIFSVTSFSITCRMYIFLQRETEEKARQPETKLSATAQTRHTARLRDAKRSRTRNPKPTHGARDRPKQPQPRAGRARASEPGRRHIPLYLYRIWPALAAGQPPCRSSCRFFDGLDASLFQGFSKMVDIRNKVAAEPKVSAQYVDKEDRATFKGMFSS